MNILEALEMAMDQRVKILLPDVDGFWQVIDGLEDEPRVIWINRFGQIQELVPTKYLFRGDWEVVPG